MRFFDFNYAFKAFDCVYDASSNVALADSAFDELDRYKWLSSGEGTDGNAIYLECDFGTPRDVDRFMIRGTNLDDGDIEYWNGSSFVTVGATPIKSADGTNYFFELSAPLNFTKFRVVGSNTITADEEKEVQEVYAFEELGQLVIPPAAIKTKRIKEQDKHKLDNAKYYIFTRGTRWEIDLQFKAHVGQADIDLINSIIERDLEFYVWINDNEEQYMNQVQKPFDFGSTLKMSIVKGDQPTYYKNLFFSGVNNKFKMVEVA